MSSLRVTRDEAGVSGATELCQANLLIFNNLYCSMEDEIDVFEDRVAT